MANSWFNVDRDGLRQILARRGKGFAVLELLQNAWDEDVTKVEIEIEAIPGLPRVGLLVRDDSPAGFADLTHAYTLFASSAKKSDPTKRGRFNLGEKLVLALCVEAKVKSTKGTVTFNRDGSRSGSRAKTNTGTEFRAVLEMTHAEFDEAFAILQTVLPPASCATYVNGTLLEYRPTVNGVWHETLPTEIADDEGYLRPTQRRAVVSIHEVLAHETPFIYEMGIPVVEHDGRWHINVEQKIPLNVDRDNVTPAYLRALRRSVLDHTVDLIGREDANSVWVKDALPEASDEAVRSVIDNRFGRAVIFDPSDTEANKRAVDAGYVLVHGRSLSKDEWAAVRRAEALKPAGQVLPSGIKFDGNTPPIAKSEWSPGLWTVANYAQALCQYALGVRCEVQYFSLPKTKKNRWMASWTVDGRSGVVPVLSINMGRVEQDWFDHPAAHQLAWDALLIHEFAHNVCADHLAFPYIDALANIGADLRHCTVRLF